MMEVRKRARKVRRKTVMTIPKKKERSHQMIPKKTRMVLKKRNLTTLSLKKKRPQFC